MKWSPDRDLLILIFVGIAFYAIGQDITKPNIVLIIADDAGYADFGFHGSKEMQTPHLDNLAKEGMLFRQAYVTAAVCGPSRAGILTGKYQQRFGFEENNVPGYMSKSCLPDDEMGLPLNQTTIADYMKSLGYHTGLIGKWHQGNAEKFHPVHRGFDEFFGFRGGARSYYPFGAGNPESRKEDKLERGLNHFQEVPGYLTDEFGREASDFITKHRAKPFFLMLAFNAVHAPMDVRRDEMERFPNLSGDRQKLAAMTYAMDRACGQVFETIRKLNLDNTIIIFTNDNGGPSDQNASMNDPLSGTKANHLEGGIRVPFILKWPGVVRENSEFIHPVSTLDLLPTLYAASGGDPSNLKEVDGVDLRPFLQNETNARPHDILFWKKETRAAVRMEDWKLIRYPDRPAELFDLREDIAETRNVADQHPELVRSMFKKLFAWELTLERAQWQLLRKYEGLDMERMDMYRK